LAGAPAKVRRGAGERRVSDVVECGVGCRRRAAPVLVLFGSIVHRRMGAAGWVDCTQSVVAAVGKPAGSLWELVRGGLLLAASTAESIEAKPAHAAGKGGGSTGIGTGTDTGAGLGAGAGGGGISKVRYEYLDSIVSPSVSACRSASLAESDDAIVNHRSSRDALLHETRSSGEATPIGCHSQLRKKNQLREIFST